MDALEVAYAGIETRELGIVSLHRRNGKVFSAHIQTFPVLNQKGNLWSILILISDESENEQNRIKVQHLEQRAALGGLSAIFAHEVRNPINNISTAVQLLKVRILPDDPNFEVLNRMQNDCARLITLMDSVLAFSRPIEARLQSVNISVQIANILERWRPRFERLNINFILQKPKQDLFVMGDMRLLEQIFTNLISNSVDVMEHTGGSLAVKISRNDIIFAQPQIEVAVSDTGPGIPDDIIERIFDPFVSTKPKGTGLGLAITKHMVTAQHGTIRVSSFPGGSVFYVNLPEIQEEMS
jgi:signal transduction histidine kinase